VHTATLLLPPQVRDSLFGTTTLDAFPLKTISPLFQPTAFIIILFSLSATLPVPCITETNTVLDPELPRPRVSPPVTPHLPRASYTTLSPRLIVHIERLGYGHANCDQHQDAITKERQRQNGDTKANIRRRSGWTSACIRQLRAPGNMAAGHQIESQGIAMV